MAEGMGMQPSLRTGHPAAMGSAVGDRESVRLHHIHGLLHHSPLSARKVCPPMRVYEFHSAVLQYIVSKCAFMPSSRNTVTSVCVSYDTYSHLM